MSKRKRKLSGLLKSAELQGGAEKLFVGAMKTPAPVVETKDVESNVDFTFPVNVLVEARKDDSNEQM